MSERRGHGRRAETRVERRRGQQAPAGHGQRAFQHPGPIARSREQTGSRSHEIGQGSAPGGRRGYLLRRLLAASDLIALALAYLATIGIKDMLGRGLAEPFSPLLFLALLPLWTFLGTLLKLYHVGDRSLHYSIADEVGPIVLVATVWSWVLLLAKAATTSGAVTILPSITLWAMSILFVIGLRLVTLFLSRGSAWYHQRVLVIGSKQDAARVVRRITRHPEYGLEVVGTAAPPGVGGRRRDDGGPASGNGHLDVSVREAAELARVAHGLGAHRVIVATAPASLEARSALIRDLIDMGLQVDLVSGDPDLCSSGAAALHYVEGLPVLTVPSIQVPRTWKAVKRTIDVVAAALGLLLASPLLAACAIGVKLSSPGPVLFRHQRVGRRGRRFELLKLRTMVADADRLKPQVAELNMHGEGGGDAGMFKVPRDPRVTRFGAFLRRWSIDELPQLWNVLTGDMSLVGPRPLIPEEAERVEGRYEVRLVMRPGITGPWQTLGRSDIGFEDMVQLDYTYVMNWTLSEDFKLLVKTLGAVLHARGAY